MDMKSLTQEIMINALSELETHLDTPVQLIVGGGGAMLLAYQFPLATADIDAIPKGISIDDLGEKVKQVALKLDIPADWLNPYFSSFTHVLPDDFRTRLVEVFSKKSLQVLALGKEDLLIMKCFAHRTKDIPHARALVRQKVNVKIVEDRLLELKERNVKNATDAIEFLDQILDLENI